MEAFNTVLDWIVLHQIRLMQLSILYRVEAQKELDKTELELGGLAMEAATFVASVGGLRSDDVKSLRTFDSFKQQVLAVRNDGYTRAMASLTENLGQVRDYERLFFSAALRAGGRTINVPSSITGSPDIMGQDLSAWHQRLLSNDVHRIQEGLTLGARLGENEAAMRARLLGHVSYGGRGGATAVARNELDTLVRTATDTFADLARAQINMENLSDGREIYVALLDTRTTDQCKSLHGTVYPSNDGPRPPVHWYCRSVRMPLVGDGPTRLPSYREWLGRLSIRDQNEVLGPKQGAAFRAGTFDLQSFSEPNWHGINLKTMAKRERQVFEVAGMDVPFQ